MRIPGRIEKGGPKAAKWLHERISLYRPDNMFLKVSKHIEEFITGR